MTDIDFNPDLNALPWPDGTARPFATGGSNLHTTYVPPHTRDWEQYAFGYRTAFEWIFDHWPVAQFNPDPIVFPQLFLCRHYIEIRLKELIQASQKLLSLPDDWPQRHDLRLLWSRLRPLLEQVWPDGPAESLDYAEEIILTFHQQDPTSMTFRYPIDRMGVRHLPEVRSLDFLELKKAMNQISNFLDACSDGVAAYMDGLQCCQ